MIRPESETENLPLSITKKCETLIKQTHTKPEGTFGFKLTKPSKTISFIPSIPIEGFCMMGLSNLEAYNSIFNIKRHDKKFKHYKFPDSKSGGLSNEKLRDDIARDMEVTDITATDFQYQRTGPIFIEELGEQV